MATAIVVGAAGGIGSAISRTLEHRNFKVKRFDKGDYPPKKRPDYLILANGSTDEGYSSQAWDRNMVNNLECSFMWARDCNANNAIILIGSLATVQGFPCNPGYQAAKAGILGLTRSLAYDFAPVRVNCVSPGYIRTPMTAESKADPGKDSLLKRWGEPEDIASVVSFLCSRNSSYITGQNIIVDGGWSIKGL